MATKKNTETEELQKTIDDLKRRLEIAEAKLGMKQSCCLGTFEPGYAEYYYTFDGGEASSCVNLSQERTAIAIASGVCWENKEDAEDFVRWMRARKVLLGDTEGYEFTSGNKNFYVHYDFTDGRFSVGSVYECKDGCLFFKSSTAAHQSIKSHEKEWRIFYGLDAESED